MRRDELIKLAHKVQEMIQNGDECELNEAMSEFDRSVRYPNASSLFFYPSNYNSRTHKPSNYAPSAEEIVDICLAFEPVGL